MAVGAESGLRKFTAAQLILMAGEDLVDAGVSEFSEWQLTVAAWRRDPLRFGLRGFQKEHPDHKRVMMEIMGAKPHNPIQMKYMEKIRPNYYRLTAAGRQEALRLLSDPLRAARSAAPAPTYPTPANKAPPLPDNRAVAKETLYDGLAEYVFQRSFVHWKDDPDQPAQWSEALGFLSAGRGKPADCVERWQDIDLLRRQAMDFCDRSELDFLPPTGKHGARRLSMLDLGRLGDYLVSIRQRFAEHLPVPAKRRAVKA